MNYQQSLYGFFDLLGDAGGLFDIIILLSAFLIKPYNEALFNYNIMNKIYDIGEPCLSFFQFWKKLSFSSYGSASSSE